MQFVIQEFDPEFQKCDSEVVLLLLYRCKKLYDGYYELRNILQLILKQQEVFKNTKHVMAQLVKSYCRLDVFEMDNTQLNTTFKGL